MRRVALIEGVRWGVAISALVPLLAVAGLSPALSWIPEPVVIAVGVTVPIAGYALAGVRGSAVTGRWMDGLAAGAVAGALSGLVGGVSYAVFGKPLLNVPVGVVVGVPVGRSLEQSLRWRDVAPDRTSGSARRAAQSTEPARSDRSLAPRTLTSRLLDDA